MVKVNCFPFFHALNLGEFWGFNCCGEGGGDRGLCGGCEEEGEGPVTSLPANGLCLP